MVEIPARPPGLRRRDPLGHQHGGAAVLRYWRGMNEADSVRLPFPASTSSERCGFLFPTARISALRFDPINGSGTFSVRGLRRGFLRFCPSEVCSERSAPPSTRLRPAPKRKPSYVRDDTGRGRSHAPDCRARPIDFSPSNWHRVAWVAIVLLACLFITALAGGMYFVVRPGPRAWARCSTAWRCP